MSMSILTIISAFQGRIRRIKNPTEVQCFDAFIKTLAGARGVLYIDQYHQSYVHFTLSPPLAGLFPTDMCEICDVIIISYSAKSSHEIKLTFLQAKKEKAQIDVLQRLTHKFAVDYRQHELLSRRPVIRPAGKLIGILDPNILNRASYESVGSFGFFIPLPFKEMDFCYFGASQLHPDPATITSKTGKVEYIPTGRSKSDETDASFYMEHFLEHLFDGKIGTPINSKAIYKDLINSIDHENIDDEKREVLEKLLDQINSGPEKRKKLPFRFLIVNTDEIRAGKSNDIDPDLMEKLAETKKLTQNSNQIRLR